MSAAHVDALLGTLRTLVVANTDPASWQLRRVALPMQLQKCSRFATALRCGTSTHPCSRLRARHCSTRIEVCERAEGLIASVLRGQALSLGVAPTLSPRKTPLDSTPVYSASPR
jgi:hypothetical protein